MYLLRFYEKYLLFQPPFDAFPPDDIACAILLCRKRPFPDQLAGPGGLDQRLAAAGVTPSGKNGSHIFRHARAVEMLRAAVPRKVIGDLLGHRSTESTAPYLKLATEDLRAIALEVPGREMPS